MKSSANLMKATVLESHGANLQIAQVTRPSPGEGEVLVRIKASGVNPLDVKIRNYAVVDAGLLATKPPQVAKAYGTEVFATVSAGQEAIVEGFGAMAIDYEKVSVEQYVEALTGGRGSDIVYDTVGGTVLDNSFHAVKQYTGHVVS